MKRIITEWREYLSEQGLGSDPLHPEEDAEPVVTMTDPARKEKDLRKDPRWKEAEFDLEKLMRDLAAEEEAKKKAAAAAAEEEAKKKAEEERQKKVKDEWLREKVRSVRPGFTLPTQPKVARLNNHSIIGATASMATAVGGTAEIDSVLKWLILNMKQHASLLGVKGSRVFLPNAGRSALRTNEQQAAMFLTRLTKDTITLRNLAVGETTGKKKGSIVVERKPGYYVYTDNRPKVSRLRKYNLLPEWTASIKLQDVKAILKAGEGEAYKKLMKDMLRLKHSVAWKIAGLEVAKPAGEYGGDPKHLSGRTVDFYLPGNDWSLSKDNKNKMKGTPAGKFLFNYAQMYGLANYPSEVWHWELNDENYAYFKDMKKTGFAPLERAIYAVKWRTKDMLRLKKA